MVRAPSCEFFALKNAFMPLCMLCVFDHVQAEGESAHWEALESFRVDVQAKFDEVSETARATNKTVEELRAMMVQFMRRDKRLRHPGPLSTDMANVTRTTKELTLSDSEHAIPYDLDAAWASGTMKDSLGNDESPAAAAVRRAGENEGTVGGQAADPIPTQEGRGEEPHATTAGVPAAESPMEDKCLLTGDSGGPLQDEAGTEQYTATCNAVQPETQCLEEPSEAVGRASSPM